MTLQQLKYAAGVARCGSISEAASKLFISQPSLSAAIKELEKDIGIEIFSRSTRGITITSEGATFLGYARQILEQAALLENRYTNAESDSRLLSVSTQHYAFAVNAFVETIRALGVDAYECTLRETRTYEILDDVRNLRSDLGILYLNEFNRRVLEKLFHDYSLEFTPLFTARAHVFISSLHPLAGKKKISLEDLSCWPRLSFEQGEYNSFHFSEEIMSTAIHKKSIKVSDRSTLFNLLIGLNAYTISTGILTTDLNGNNIVSVPLSINEVITVGYIQHRSVGLSQAASLYLENLKAVCNALT